MPLLTINYLSNKLKQHVMNTLLLMDIRLEGERGTDVVEKLRAEGLTFQ
jgi:FixJ family two-component response regulator